MRVPLLLPLPLLEVRGAREELGTGFTHELIFRNVEENGEAIAMGGKERTRGREGRVGVRRREERRRQGGEGDAQKKSRREPVW